MQVTPSPNPHITPSAGTIKPPIVVSPGTGTGNTGTNPPVIITPGPNTGTGGSGHQPTPSTSSITGTGSEFVISFAYKQPEKLMNHNLLLTISY